MEYGVLEGGTCSDCNFSFKLFIGSLPLANIVSTDLAPVTFQYTAKALLNIFSAPKPHHLE